MLTQSIRTIFGPNRNNGVRMYSLSMDSSLFKPVSGEAVIDYEIVKTPVDQIQKKLSEKFDTKEAKRISNSHEFYKFC